MKDKKLSFLVIENAPDVCEGIIRRMEKFEKWQSEGYCVGVKDSIEKISTAKPDLLFLDWSLNGGSAYEVLQAIQNLQDYNPYVIFNTGFQKDNPEIPQEIINNYKVDKYLVKPLWENLRNNLPDYLKDAEKKANTLNNKSKIVWVDDEKGNKVPLVLENLICICQHPSNPRSRIFYMNNTVKEINVPMQWNKCVEMLQQNNIDYFITKSRSHLIVRNFVEKFEKPFVRLRNFHAKIEVVKENIKTFENWLLEKE